MIPELKQGDIFATRNPMALGRFINFFQKLWSKDNKSKYSHAGIVTDGLRGITFESLTRITYGNLDKYRGKEIIIARYTNMTPERYLMGWASIKHLNRKIYPYHRLPLYLIPFMAKYVHITNRPVCSELVAMFLYHAGLRKSKYYFGINPDDLVDRWKIHKNIDIIYEGLWE